MFETIGTFFVNSIDIFIGIAIFGIVLLFIYDRYIQRTHQLLINYPVIGRMRYVFEALREPLRQYFADEKFYESRDKIDWVYKAAKDLPNFMSFSLSQPLSGAHFIIKHSSHVLNESEVNPDLGITFGPNRPKPFKTTSPVI